MTMSFWDMLAGTPWWVYVLFIYLVKMGYLATKPNQVELKRLLIMPTVLVGLSLTGIFTITKGTPLDLLAALGTACIGLPLGWLHYKILNVRAVRNTKQLYIPGTWSVLILILAIFAVKYYAGFQMDVNPAVFLKPQYALPILAAYGLFIGLFLGRMIYSLRCIKYGPYIGA